ncbi:phenylalanine--tRNA ligase subunit beta [Aquimonas voraii]|uniref:Phenylalanine--tRNA ligase beta subunit n=1 Tax=Aquimonas voraii TaxID=265719 RepID=A0A1G6YUX6_9GAMM|nr:phenylalanine--tRNA ligase subunit beta [Aquimonas voraii]SDD94324.1 phenylalanyl-tRNA synthetase beta subunit [Aquimonas voraii]
MKFSENWLREHVTVEASREELAARLTAIGLEVEEITALGEGLAGVVVAQILDCARHPEADRLQVCTVDTGSGTVQIVCGAPNARPGLKAPLATVGAELPGGLKIKPAKLRGVESFGMLCSAKELGVDADASGLMELPADAPVGAAFADYLGLPDASIEIKLTPNRADCFGVRGIAYDVAAVLGANVNPLDVPAAAVESADALSVELNAGAAAPRYCGRVIEGVDASAPTPLWMAERLRRSGIRPISLLVDVTQYVMLELGQPMHAFDRATLKGPVGVRAARAGESLKLLDERAVTLDEGFLVITDADRAVALAGVMGGWDTRVTTDSRSVFLESAHFAPEAIIGRARKLGMHTDASHRFERGVDPELPSLALERATQLILAHAGGKAGPVTEAALPAHLPLPKAVRLRRARLARVLGVHIADAEVERILRALGMQVEAFDGAADEPVDALRGSHIGGGWWVTPPSRRFDIAIEEDLIEEVVRIHGYEAIPTSTPTGAIPLAMPSETRLGEGELRRALAGRGYRETICFAFVEHVLLDRWGLAEGAITLANPLSAELAVMRTGLLPGLVQALAHNRDRQDARPRLFELGRVFHQGESGPIETLRFAAAACGRAEAEQWGLPARALDFHDVKADLESVLALSGEPARVEFRPTTAAFLHPGRGADVWFKGRSIGCIGHLHPALAKVLDLDEEVVVFEVELAPVLERALPRAQPISRFPSVRRDIAVLVAEQHPWLALEACLRSALEGRVQAIQLFDQYQGKGIEPGFRSLAIGLILQDVSRTLTDQDADQAIADAVAALSRTFGATLRG